MCLQFKYVYTEGNPVGLHVSIAVSKTVTLEAVTSTSGASERVRTTGKKVHIITVGAHFIKLSCMYVCHGEKQYRKNFTGLYYISYCNNLETMVDGYIRPPHRVTNVYHIKIGWRSD